MLLFEVTSLGMQFTVTRLLIDIPGIIIIAAILAKLVSKEEVEKIYQNTEKFDQ